MRSCVQPFKEGKDTTQIKRGKKQNTGLSGVGPRGKRPRKRSRESRPNTQDGIVCARVRWRLAAAQHTERARTRTRTQTSARANMRASPQPLCASMRALVATLTAGALLCRTNLHAVGPNASRILSRIASACAARNGLCCKVCAVRCMLHLACCMLHACCTCMLNACCMDCCLPSGRRSTVRRSRAPSRMRATNQGTRQTRPAQADGRAGGWMGRAFTLVRAFVCFEATSCDDRAGPGGRTCSKLSQWSSYSST